MIDRGAQLTEWYRAQLDDPSITASIDGSAASGYSNEVLFATVHYGDHHAGHDDAEHGHAHAHDQDQDHEHVVVRLAPSGPPLFPTYDLRMQVEVQAFAGRVGVAVPDPIVLEDDPAWLGAPFLVMPLVPGRVPGEIPVSCDWITALAPDGQQRLEEHFLDQLATLHRAPLEGLPESVRRPGSLADEVRWWLDYAGWACEQADAGPLRALFERCGEHLPSTEPPASVLWGDVRLGNTIVGDDLGIEAVLDWEMATVGPAEADVAWYTSQNAVMARFFGATVPGFLDRDGLLHHYEAALGRPLADLRWHEGFAMARSAAVHHRAEVVGALLQGGPEPDPAESFLVTYTAKQLAKPG